MSDRHRQPHRELDRDSGQETLLPISFIPSAERGRQQGGLPLIGSIVERFGRVVAWALLALLFLALLGGAATAWALLFRPDPGISPAEALAEGGHTIEVLALAKATGAPLRSGSYTVETHDGRPPRDRHGDLANGVAEIVVGPDWIGQIRVVQPRCSPPYELVTTLIGAPYDWGPRTLTFDADC